ncbi:MAG: lipoyl(octanoyl) transferase LipB [Kordiimonadaceae bacterium]|jgi:lipoyl(octanoyl) transferase|nr:lipoyl(octanoyl) transferase LipB [Kordiimonadaceae bacterium]MBT6329792.1 lipoyl(octanoyl) transferase LipB [Kordiimonadaceae bacterium]MBT7581413.1 lipoyl(octanoyl) transferase LipB [Kordiimonadaceae bacterium]
MTSGKIDWKFSEGLTDYEDALLLMEKRVADIRAGTADQLVWFVEHPPLYTAGTSSKDTDLLEPKRFPVHNVGRGGQYTYHGPGQRVVYVMLDLNRYGKDVRKFVANLERWVIDTLAEFNIKGETRSGRVGVWVTREGGQEDKIAALGVRIRKWVTFHGICINVEPDLGHYSGIVPCGISGHGVTSLVDLGLPVNMDDLDAALQRTWGNIFENED